MELKGGGRMNEKKKNPAEESPEAKTAGREIRAGEIPAEGPSAGETSVEETSAGETFIEETSAGVTSAEGPSAGVTSAEETSAGERTVGEALDEIEKKVVLGAEERTEADRASDEAVASALDLRLAQKRRRRFGLIATLITVGVVAAAVVLNILVGLLAGRYPLSVDLTAGSLYGISDETADYLKGLDRDVAIHVLATRESLSYSYDYMDLVQAGKTLDAFAQNSGRIAVDYIDLAANPTFAANYPDYALKAYDVIFESAGGDTGGKNVAVLNLSEMFDYVYDENQSLGSSSHVEQSVLNEILYVVSGVRPKIAFIGGFGELASESLQSLLKGNNYEAVPWNLVTGEAPEGAGLAVWFGPENDPDEATLRKLDAFLAAGGKLLLFTDPYCDSAKQPVLSAFLSEWGLAAVDGFAFETDSSRMVGTTPYLPIVDFDDSAYSSGLENSGTYVAFYLPRPLAVLFESKGDVSAHALLSLSNTSGYHDASLINNYTVQNADVVGDVTVAAVGENAATGGKVFLFGSTHSFDADFLTTSVLSNAEYIVGVLNTLEERVDAVTIAPKNLSGEANTMTGSDIVVSSAVFIALIPLCVLGAGAWVLIRRHRM